MARQKKYEIDMCSGSVLKKMLVFALPIMFSGILQLLFNAADIVVVGRFAGDRALAAVGATSSLIHLLTNLFIGLSVGTNVLVAQYYGAKDEEGMTDAVHTSMLLSVLGGLGLTVIGFFAARPLLVMMSAPPEVLELSVIYMRIYFLGMTSTMIYNFGAAVLRAIGDTQRPLYYLLLAGVINVVLNLYFVISLHMGVAGVAWATSISQTVSAILVVRCMMKLDGPLKLRIKLLRLRGYVLKQILRIGVPAGATGIMFSLSNVVIQSSINSFGETAIAAGSAAFNIEGFVFTATNAFHSAIISFVSQNFGAKRIDRINRVLGVGIFYSVMSWAILGGLVIVFGKPLLHIYTDTPEVIEMGYIRLVFLIGTFVLCAIMDALTSALRGIGYSVAPMVSSLVCVCGIRLLWLATIFRIPRFHSYMSIFISYPISWIAATIVLLICYIRAKKKINRLYANSTI